MNQNEKEIVLKILWALFWLQASFVASPEKRSGWSQHKQGAPQPWCYRCPQIMGIKQDVVGKCNVLLRASSPTVPEPQEHTLALRTLLNRRWNLLRMNHSCALSRKVSEWLHTRDSDFPCSKSQSASQRRRVIVPILGTFASKEWVLAAWKGKKPKR